MSPVPRPHWKKRREGKPLWQRLVYALVYVFSLIAGGRIMPGASAKAPQFIRPLFQRIRTQEASAAETAEMVQVGIPSEPIAVKTHAIASEESLWEIAEMEYGSGEKWIDIWQANRSDISDKTLIQEGAALIVPAMELHALPIVETAVKENLPQMPSERQGEIVKQGEAIITSLDELMHAPNVAASVREEIESDVLKASIAVNQLKMTETVPAAVDSVVGVLDAARNAIQITSFFDASGELTNPLATITTQQIIATSTLVAGNQILSQGVGSSVTSNGFQALTTEQIQETAINAVHKVAEVISPVMDTSAISVSAVVQQVEEAQEATTKALQNGNVPLATSSAAEAVTNAIVAGAALMNDASTENAVSAAVETLSALNVAAVSVIPAVESVTAAAETSHVNKTVLTDPVIEVITRVVTSVMTLVTPGLALSTAESANAPTADGLQNAIWTGVEAALQKLQAENNLPTFTSAVSNASSTAATLPAAAVMAAEASQASASATQQAVAEIENSVDLSAWARSIGVSNLWKRYEKSGTVASGEESFDGFVSYLRSEGYKAMADMVTARAPGTESVVSQVAKPAPVAATAAIETASSGAVAASSAAQTAAPLTSQEERDSLKKWANSIGVSNLWKRYEKSGTVAEGQESFDGFVSYLRGEGYQAMADMVVARAPGTEKIVQAPATPIVAAATAEGETAAKAASAPVQQVIQQTSAEERDRLVSWAKNLGVINLWNRYAHTGTALGNESFDGFVSYLRGEGYKAMADMVVARAPGTEKKIEAKEAAVEEKGPAATQQAVSQVTETPTVETQATVSAEVTGTESAEALVQEAVLPVLTETPTVETQTPLSAEAVEAPSTEAAPVQEAQSGSAMAATAAVEEAKQTIDTLASEANAQSLELQSQTFSEENIKKALENIPSLIEGAEAAVKTAETALESAPESAETQALVDAANTSLGIAKGLVEEAKEASTIGDDTAAASKISQTIETVNEAIGKAGETVEAADAAVAGEAEVAAAATEAFSQIVSGQIEAEPVASAPGVAPAASKVQKVPTIQLGEAPDLALTSRLTGALSKAVRKVTVAETSKAEYAPIQLIDGGQNVIKALTAIAGSSADGRVGDQIKEIISLLSKDKISASEIDSLTGRTAEVQQAIAEEASAGKISFDEANEFQDILDQNLIILENAISKNQKKEAIATLSLGIAAIAQKTSDPAIVSALGAAPTKSAFDEMGLVVSPTGSGGKGTLMETSNPELASLGRQVNLKVAEAESDAGDVSVENVLASPEFQKEMSHGAKTPGGLALETLHNVLAVVSNEEVTNRLASAGKLSASDLGEIQKVKAGIAELTQEGSNFGGTVAHVPDAAEGGTSMSSVTDQSLSRNDPELAAKVLSFLEHPVTIAVSAFIPGATVARFVAATAIKTDLADQLREGKIAAEGAALMSFGDSSPDSPFSNIASGPGTEVSPLTQADMTIREVKGVDEATKAVRGAIANAQILISSMKERGLDTSIAEMQLAQVKSDSQSIAEAELNGTIPDLLNEIKDIIADVSATNSASALTPEVLEAAKPGVLSDLADKVSFDEENAKSDSGLSEKDLKATQGLEAKGTRVEGEVMSDADQEISSSATVGPDVHVNNAEKDAIRAAKSAAEIPGDQADLKAFAEAAAKRALEAYENAAAALKEVKKSWDTNDAEAEITNSARAMQAAIAADANANLAKLAEEAADGKEYAKQQIQTFLSNEAAVKSALENAKLSAVGSVAGPLIASGGERDANKRESGNNWVPDFIGMGPAKLAEANAYQAKENSRKAQDEVGGMPTERADLRAFADAAVIRAAAEAAKAREAFIKSAQAQESNDDDAEANYAALAYQAEQATRANLAQVKLAADAARGDKEAEAQMATILSNIEALNRAVESVQSQPLPEGDVLSSTAQLRGPSEKEMRAIQWLEMKGITEQVNSIASQISGRAASIQLSELTVQNTAAKDSTTKADAEAAVKAAREAVIIAQQTLNDATVAAMLSGSESAQNDLHDLDITAAIAENRVGAAENRLKTGEYLGAIASSKSAVQSAALVVTNSQIAVTTAQNSLQENKNAVIDMSGPDTRTRVMTQNVSGDSLGSAGSLGELSPSGVGALPSSVVAMTQLSDLQSSVNQLSGSANKLALQLNNELKLSNPDLMVVSSLVNQIISKAEITNQLINDGKGQLGIAGDAGNLQLSNAKQSAEKAGLALLKIDRKETEKAVQDALQSIKVASDTITKNSDKVAKQLQAEGEALTQTQTPEQEAAAIQSEIQVALQKQEEVKIQTIVSAVNSATAFEQSADNAAAKVTEAFAAKNATEAVHSALSGAKAALSAADAALTVTIITGSESGEAQARSARTAAIEAKERAEAAADALSDGQEKDALLFAYESGEKTAESAALSRVAVADATPRGIAVGGGATTRSMNGESSGSSDSSAAATAAIIAAENAANELAKAANPETNAEFSDFGQSGELPLASGSFESATAVAGGKASVSLEDALHNLEVAKANGVSGEELSAFYDQVASALKQATENEAAAANGDAASIVGELENKAQPAATGEVRAEAAARVEELETEMRNAIHAGNYGAALSYLSAANRASIQANQETVAPVPVASNVDPFGGLGGLDNAGSDTTGNTDTVSDGTLSDFGASGNLPSTAIQDTVVAAPGVQADFDTGTADVVPSSTGADFDYSGGDVYVPSNSDFDFSGGDVYVPPPPPPSPSHDARFSDFGSSGGGGGGGGGTGVICTTLHEYGWMDEKMWGADEAYGRLLSPVVRDGYHLWAVPLAHMMRKSVLVRGAVGTIAMFWAKEMAYQMGARSRGSLFGKLLMSAGIVICHRLGKARRLAARTSLVPVNSEAAAKNY